jgi:hypothetical protein
MLATCQKRKGGTKRDKNKECTKEGGGKNKRKEVRERERERERERARERE